MTQKTVHVCDVCKKTIEQLPEGHGNAFIDYWSAWQEWPVGDNTYEVCLECCNILRAAERLSIIPAIKRRQFYLQACYPEVTPGKWQTGPGSYIVDDNSKEE